MAIVTYVFEHLASLESLLNLSPLGLITDIDGTISHITSSPQDAQVSNLCRRYLRKLTRCLDLVAAISGRPVLEALAMVGVKGMVYGGNHGLEWWVNGVLERAEGVERYRGQLDTVLHELKAILSLPGIILEDKEIGIAIHYRQCSDWIAAEKTILSAIEALPSAQGLRIRQGKAVVELQPPMAADKGTALSYLVNKYHLEGAFYLGDDQTDVDAFVSLHRLPIKGAALGVVSLEAPAALLEEADYILNGVADVERFLGWLVSALAKRGSSGLQTGGEAK